MNTNKTAVITGASRGIGFSLALAFASAGDQVIAVARNEEKLLLLKQHYPNHIVCVAADITTEAGRKKLEVAIQNQKIDYLVNNVGMLTPLMTLKKYSEKDLRTIFDTNIISPILLTNLLLPHLTNGRILNITTVAAENAVENVGGYNITKAAVNMWTRVLQLELQKENIAVGYVIPGEVDTDMQGDLRCADIHDFPLATEFQKAASENTLISPDIVASFLTWLVKEIPTNQFQRAVPWNIYDPSHHSKWLGKNKIPLPLNKDKLAFSVE